MAAKLAQLQPTKNPFERLLFRKEPRTYGQEHGRRGQRIDPVLVPQQLQQLVIKLVLEVRHIQGIISGSNENENKKGKKINKWAHWITLFAQTPLQACKTHCLQ
jgi:hypothetical protein